MKYSIKKSILLLIIIIITIVLVYFVVNRTKDFGQIDTNDVDNLVWLDNMFESDDFEIIYATGLINNEPHIIYSIKNKNRSGISVQLMCGESTDVYTEMSGINIDTKGQYTFAENVELCDSEHVYVFVSANSKEAFSAQHMEKTSTFQVE